MSWIPGTRRPTDGRTNRHRRSRWRPDSRRSRSRWPTRSSCDGGPGNRRPPGDRRLGDRWSSGNRWLRDGRFARSRSPGESAARLPGAVTNSRSGRKLTGGWGCRACAGQLGATRLEPIRHRWALTGHGADAALDLAAVNAGARACARSCWARAGSGTRRRTLASRRSRWSGGSAARRTLTGRRSARSRSRWPLSSRRATRRGRPTRRRPAGSAHGRRPIDGGPSSTTRAAAARAASPALSKGLSGDQGKHDDRSRQHQEVFLHWESSFSL
jgi:hypothetical protein